MHCTECHSNDLAWTMFIDEFGDQILQEGEEWPPFWYKTKTAYCRNCDKEVEIQEEY